MLRVEVSEAGQEALPAIDVDDAVVVIGSATNARIRLPGGAAGREHVRVEGNRWRALAPVRVDGIARDSGEIGDGITLELAGYRLRLAPAPSGTTASPAQRTESLARELMRGLLGNGAQPTLEIERGPAVGASARFAPTRICRAPTRRCGAAGTARAPSTSTRRTARRSTARPSRARACRCAMAAASSSARS